MPKTTKLKRHGNDPLYGIIFYCFNIDINANILSYHIGWNFQYCPSVQTWGQIQSIGVVYSLLVRGNLKEIRHSTKYPPQPLKYYATPSPCSIENCYRFPYLC